MFSPRNTTPGAACAPISKFTGTRSNGRRALPDAPVKKSRLDPSRRGSALSRIFRDPQAGATAAPEVPDYDQIEATKQHWRDLIGYYTRFGDIRELLDNDG